MCVYFVHSWKVCKVSRLSKAHKTQVQTVILILLTVPNKQHRDLQRIQYHYAKKQPAIHKHYLLIMPLDF